MKTEQTKLPDEVNIEGRQSQMEMNTGEKTKGAPGRTNWLKESGEPAMAEALLGTTLATKEDGQYDNSADTTPIDLETEFRDGNIVYTSNKGALCHLEIDGIKKILIPQINLGETTNGRLSVCGEPLFYFCKRKRRLWKRGSRIWRLRYVQWKDYDIACKLFMEYTKENDLDPRYVQDVLAVTINLVTHSLTSKKARKILERRSRGEKATIPAFVEMYIHDEGCRKSCGYLPMGVENVAQRINHSSKRDYRLDESNRIAKIMGRPYC